jgi:transcription-repair coupling factor (superfamily II helicase)
MPILYQHLINHITKLLQQVKAGPGTRIYNLSIPHFALLLLFKTNPFVVIENSTESADALYNDLLFFRQLVPGNSRTIRYFPPASSPELIGKRASVLLAGGTQSNIGIITSAEACRTGFSFSLIKDAVITVKRGLSIERDSLNEMLSGLGYKKVSVVVEKGEYSQREWIFDIYPTTEDLPLRVEFFGDEIEVMRSFDIETQRSLREVQYLTIFPATEDDPNSTIIDELAHSTNPDVFVVEGTPGSLKTGTHPIFCEKMGCVPVFKELPFYSVSHLPFTGEGTDAMEHSIKGMGILPEERKELGDIPSVLKKAGYDTLIVLPSEAQAERLKDILFDGGVIAPVIKCKDLESYAGSICIVTGILSSGMLVKNVLVLTDRELFGERPAYRPLKRSKASRLLFTIDDLKAGDLVVHKDHGIGRFTGLQRQRTDRCEEDLITLEYAHGDRLYIPFYSIDKLQKYSAGEGHTSPIDRLGSKKWQKTKHRVKEKIREMADKLIKLYAERSVSRGFVFSEDTPMHREFDDFFPYDETPDQIRAFEEIQKHMHSETPMDMLLCGDVGYGKTEVALKAAFRAVFDGTQVAVLVPTTLLAEQHFRTFKMRFSGFPVKIDYLSRFKNKQQVKQSIKALADGETDIVIGTHMLLNRNVRFHDIGLLIIDEEHRFGVAQKERLKELKKGVDILTLTATPIPRTLHMALSGIREIATIETAPEERVAVRSIVTPFTGKTIKEAVDRELRRDGQVFFVHNRIGDIEKTADYIRKLMPDARLAIGHGQMPEVEMERVMLRFLNRDINVLVCTAIIGSGLDIPTANTIIVDRADTFGLADLYQLRGRVGRSNVQAYAYFLIPGEDRLTDEAKKRLQAIQEMSYLGAGFRLALKDLDIRGAGNLLGAEQSGCIHGVGFDMYMEMLERTVAELKGQEVVEEIEPAILLRLSAFIPDNYISDITLRLSIYRRISTLKSLDALVELRDELSDRFGTLPEETINLLRVIKIKLLSKQLYIIKVTDVDRRYRFFFLLDADNTYKIPEDFFDRLMKALFSLSSGTSIRFLPDGFELDARHMPLHEAIEEVEETLQKIVEMMAVSSRQ